MAGADDGPPARDRVWVLSPLRMCIGPALPAAIVSEFVGGERGIGFLASSSTNTFKSAGVYAAITVTIVVARLLDVCSA